LAHEDITMQDIASRLARLQSGYARLLVGMVALAELVNRVWVASVFWTSGTVKLQSWSSTLYLFEHEYAVPLLPPVAAAWLGTAAELILPLLLFAGLAGRLAAGSLVLFNVVAVISYPGLNAAGIQAHMIWGTMLLVTTLRGPGLLSVDALAQWWLAQRRRGPTGAGSSVHPQTP
jgi:putative oxidoreductase